MHRKYSDLRGEKEIDLREKGVPAPWLEELEPVAIVHGDGSGVLAAMAGFPSALR
jgi:hypothetical protein